MTRTDLLAQRHVGLRAALYARFSTDGQNPTSVEQQLRLCRDHAARIGAHAVREFHDDAVSGQVGEHARPGFQALMAFVRAGGCDVVIAEHSDRVARAGAAGWAAWEEFRSLGVRYTTVLENDVTATLQGVSSLVSELKLEDATHRTRRGLKDRVEAGRSAGGLSYGYARKRAYDAAGEPIRGLLEIDEAQAAVVIEIFTRYAAGESPKAIVVDLNRRGVPAPRGGLWGVSTIVGNARRGNGVIHNALYAGERVWGRQTFTKNRVTGSRRGRANAAEAITRRDVADLRIVPADLWERARARHTQASRASDEGQAPARARRPRRLLQGLIVCGSCGGTMQRSGPKLGLACATRLAKGACDNGRRPGYPAIEARVIASIRTHFLRPDAIELAVRHIQEELQADARDAGARTARAQRDLAEVKRRADRFLEMAADRVITDAELTEKLAPLRARRAELEAALADAPATADVRNLPSATAQLYRRLVEDMAEALDAPEDPAMVAGREAVRRLITRIRFDPKPGFNDYDLTIEGDLAPLLALGPETQKARLAAGLPGSLSKGTMGAGTRPMLTLGPIAPYEVAA